MKTKQITALVSRRAALDEQLKAAFRPTKAQTAAAIAAIKAEKKLIGGLLVCKSAGHCAMGTLLASVGATTKQLNGFDGNGNWPLDLQIKLFDRYGIDFDDSTAIISANDSVHHDESEDDDELVKLSKAEHREREKVVIAKLRELGKDGRIRTHPDPKIANLVENIIDGDGF